MPYIIPERRPALQPKPFEVAESAGELNYQISCLLNDYIVHHGLSYNRTKDCTAACFDAAIEFSRRVVAPYENLKIEENGDVYDGALELLADPPF